MLAEQMPERKKDIFMFLWLNSSRALYNLNLQRLFKEHIETYGVVFLTKEEFFEINREEGAPEEVSAELWEIIPLISAICYWEMTNRKNDLREALKRMLAKRKERLKRVKQKS